MGFLAGKRILILGVASKLSIASGIAAAMHREGAELALTYQNDKLKSRVEGFAESWDSELVFPCDVTSDEQITKLFQDLGGHWDGLDCIVHCLAYAPAHELDGNFVDVTTRDGFLTAHEISSYSLAGPGWQGTDAEPSWLYPDSQLSWSSSNTAKLQCHGIGESEPGS